MCFNMIVTCMTTYKRKQGTEIRSDRVEITRIEKVNFVSEVYRQLRQMIVSGTWEEGSKIASENELAKTFHVSRVLIR